MVPVEVIEVSFFVLRWPFLVSLAFNSTLFSFVKNNEDPQWSLDVWFLLPEIPFGGCASQPRPQHGGSLYLSCCALLRRCPAAGIRAPSPSDVMQRSLWKVPTDARVREDRVAGTGKDPKIQGGRFLQCKRYYFHPVFGVWRGNGYN